jgi:phosphate starvation-inducible PhoH-like protein
MQTHEMVFSIGPAGTGKTFLAVAHALALLRTREVDRLLLVRPAVEAGESLGFLPGDLEEKINPYIQPLRDALIDLLGSSKMRRLIESGVVEAIPLAYMRGRTLSSAFIILDEAQNTTATQMKMFLTRMGNGSRVVVTGDITQIDLDRPEDSGLIAARHLLEDIEGIAFATLDREDVVRHHLVREIIDAFDNSGEEKS